MKQIIVELSKHRGCIYEVTIEGVLFRTKKIQNVLEFVNERYIWDVSLIEKELEEILLRHKVDLMHSGYVGIKTKVRLIQYDDGDITVISEVLGNTLKELRNKRHGIGPRNYDNIVWERYNKGMCGIGEEVSDCSHNCKNCVEWMQ